MSRRRPACPARVRERCARARGRARGAGRRRGDQNLQADLRTGHVALRGLHGFGALADRFENIGLTPADWFLGSTAPPVSALIIGMSLAPTSPAPTSPAPTSPAPMSLAPMSLAPLNRHFLGVEQSATGRAWRDRLDERGSARALAIVQRRPFPGCRARVLGGPGGA